MFKDIRNLIKHTSIYTIGNFISKILNVLLVPVYTKYIDVGMFGVYSILQVTKQFAVGMLHFGIPNALIRWLSLEEYKNKKGSILFSSLSTILFISGGIILLMSTLNLTISKFFFGSNKYTKVLLFIGIIIGFKLINRMGLSYIRFKEKSILYITISISRFFLQLIITIYFVAFLKVGIIGIFYGQLGGEAISLLFLFPYLLKNSTYSINFAETKEMIKFGFPLAFSGISSRILNMGDRYILGFLTNWSVVGVYSLGYKFANLVKTMFIRSFRRAFIPKAWKKLKDDNAKRFYAKLLTYFVFFIFWVSLFLSIYAKGIIHLFARDKSYWDAALIVPIAAFSIAIKGMFPIVKMGLQIKKKTKYVAYIVSSSAVLNIGLNFILIPNLQMYGAALATFLSFIFMFLAGYFYSHKFYPVKFEWNRILKICLVISGIYLISLLFNPFPLILRILLKLLLLLSYPIILYFLDFYDEQELNRLKGAWMKWKDPKNWKDNFKDIDIQ